MRLILPNWLVCSLCVTLLCHLLVVTCFAETLKNQELMEVEVDAFSNPMTAQKSLLVSNLTGAVARISDVKSSCGCTSVSFSKTSVQPGEKLPLLVRLDFSSKASSYSSDLLVSWNNQITTKITIKVVLVNLLSVEPRTLQLSLTKSEPKKIVINLQNAHIDRSSLTVLVSTDDGQDLSAKVTSLGQSGWCLDLVEMQPPQNELTFIKVILKKSDSEYQTRYLVCKRTNDKSNIQNAKL